MNKFIANIGQAASLGGVERAAVPPLERRRLRAYIALLLLDRLLIYVGMVIAAKNMRGKFFQADMVLSEGVQIDWHRRHLNSLARFAFVRGLFLQSIQSLRKMGCCHCVTEFVQQLKFFTQPGEYGLGVCGTWFVRRVGHNDSID